jgi:signal transduction histidine kinase
MASQDALCELVAFLLVVAPLVNTGLKIAASYDQELRERLDRMLQRRACVGGFAYSLIVLWAAWRAHLALLPIVGLSAAFAFYATFVSRQVFGKVDRRKANAGFAIGCVAYALGLMASCNFLPSSLFVVPLVILVYDGFSEGQTRRHVTFMLLAFTTVPIAFGAPPFRIVAAAGVGALIHWFAEGRDVILRAALGELRIKACELHEANERARQMCEELEARTAELSSNNKTLRATKNRLLQSEKLAAIGQLAAGLSHEINNPLAVILGFAQGLERRIGDDHPLRLPVSSIVRESLRCHSLVQELLTFSRTANRTIEGVDVNALLRASLQLLEPKARLQGTRIALDTSEEVSTVVANRTHLQQVIVNLGNNALDAIGGEGVVTLRSRRAGGSIIVDVEDTGPGVPPTIRDRIFDAFFTTKEVGKGTGLGLSIALEIVHQHGGALELHDGTGGGTVMRVALPLVPPAGSLASVYDSRVSSAGGS